MANHARQMGRCLIVTSTVASIALGAGSCASAPLDRSEVLAQIGAACDAFEMGARDIPGSDGDGLPTVLGLSTPRNLIREAHVDSAVAQELDPLEDALGTLVNTLPGLGIRLDEENYFEYEETVAEARQAEQDLTRAARTLGVPECAPPEIAEAIDAVEARLAERAAATAPSGDYPVDLQAACDRFDQEMLEALIDYSPGVVGSVEASLDIVAAYEQLHRDLQRLDPGDRADEHDRLLELIEEAITVARDLRPASDSQEELDAVKARLVEVTDEAERVASADCDL